MEYIAASLDGLDEIGPTELDQDASTGSTEHDQSSSGLNDLVHVAPLEEVATNNRDAGQDYSQHARDVETSVDLLGHQLVKSPVTMRVQTVVTLAFSSSLIGEPTQNLNHLQAPYADPDQSRDQKPPDLAL